MKRIIITYMLLLADTNFKRKKENLPAANSNTLVVGNTLRLELLTGHLIFKANSRIYSSLQPIGILFLYHSFIKA